MRNGRLLAILAGILVFALVGAAASSGAGSQKQAEPIKIGTIMSLSGALAVFGIAEKNAIELAIKEANRSGGINGRRLEWKVYDPAGDTAQGVSLTRRLVDSDRVHLIVGGGASSGVALAMQQVLTPRGMFFASGEADPGISNPVSKNPTTFQTTVTSQTVVESLLRYAKSKGVKTVAILGDTGAFGQSGVTSAKDLADSIGVTVKTASYSGTTTDLTPQLRELSQSDPGAYIIWTAGASGVIGIRNAAALGLNDKALIMTAHSYANPTFMRQAGTSAKNVVVPVVNATVFNQVVKSLKGAQKRQLTAFNNLYKKRFNQSINIYAAEAYDAANVAIRALRLTKGDTNGTKMAKALEKAGNFVGVMGTFHFSANDHYGLRSSDVRIARWSGSGWLLQKK